MPGRPSRATPGSCVCVALGSNLGDSPRLLVEAMDALDRIATGAVRRSSIWWSTPDACPPGSPVFANAAVVLAPRRGETPESLLAKLQALEREFGRRPKQVLNEARPLDLDLIAWAGEVRSGPVLTLPHPRAHLRRFVLAPLAELVPEFVLPGQVRTVCELLDRAPPDPGLRRWGSPAGGL
ncbi:MAG: 2-amino-4-hydroxy-6-hydroxymethyldihydropteridine diphosphokinase [Verrucomicrobiae bacterium]|nr:2-amino-4-hydroxy-6-hydroxymethyldihydropteridine diphosphokinase [Verrucomicrobiae bacterium]